MLQLLYCLEFFTHTYVTFKIKKIREDQMKNLEVKASITYTPYKLFIFMF